MAETLKSSSSFPAPLEDFDICFQWSCSLHRNVSLATIPSAIRAAGLAARLLARSVMRLLGTWCVPGLQGVMKFRLLVVFRSHPSVITGALFVHILPCVACLFSCSHTCGSCHAALCLTLYARRMASAWSSFKFPLNTYFSSWIFQRKSGLGGIFYLFLFY